MSEHTPGLLTLEEVASDSGRIKHLCPVDREGMSLLTVVEHDGVKFAAVYSDDDARRLVACWNACEGMHTEALERGQSLADQIVDALNQCNSLRAVNAELLEALGEARRWIGDGDMGDGMAREIWTPKYTAAVDLVDAAIASARKQGEQG